MQHRVWKLLHCVWPYLCLVRHQQLKTSRQELKELSGTSEVTDLWRNNEIPVAALATGDATSG